MKSPQDQLTHRPTSSPSRITDIVASIESQLEGLDPSPFSEKAFTLFRNKIKKYIADLVRESVKQKKNLGLDVISATNVNRACENLKTSAGRRNLRYLGSMSNIVLGVFAGLVAKFLWDKQFDPVWPLIMFLVIMITSLVISLYCHFFSES